MKIHVDIDKCTGCRICEVVCYYSKSGKFNPRKSRIGVTRVRRVGLDAPIVCLQCPKPKCVESCPEKALSKDDGLGIVKVDEERCVGCGICAEECIIGAINTDPDTGIPLICDLCHGSPECVAWCPTNALSYKSSGKRTQHKWAYIFPKMEAYIKKFGLPSEVLDKYKIWLSR